MINVSEGFQLLLKLHNTSPSVHENCFAQKTDNQIHSLEELAVLNALEKGLWFHFLTTDEIRRRKTIC